MSVCRTALVIAVALAAGCGNESDPGDPGPGGLAVDSTVPAPAAQAAEFGQLVSVYFDRALDPATVTGSTIGVLFPDGRTVQGSVAYRDAQHAVDINLPLMPGADYRGVVTPGVRGTGGESVSGNYTWDFRTRPTTRVVIDQSTTIATVPVMAVDPAGVVHAAYVDSATTAVRYARCASACAAAVNWSAATVATGAGAASRIDLAVSSTGGAAIAYYAGSAGDLVVASCATGCGAAGGWTAATVDGASADVGLNPSIAISSTGILHVLYFNRTDEDLRYVTCPGGCTSAAAWSVPVTIDNAALRGEVSDVAIGAGGAVIAAWTGGVNGVTVFGTCTTGCTTAASWTVLPLTVTAGFTARVRIAADSGLRPVVLFGVDEVTVAALCRTTACGTEAGWAFVGLGQDTGINAVPALVTDPSGQLHVTYASLFRGLRYISCTRSCDSSPALWTAGNLDVMGDVFDAAVAVDADGQPMAIARLESGRAAFIR